MSQQSDSAAERAAKAIRDAAARAAQAACGGALGGVTVTSAGGAAGANRTGSARPGAPEGATARPAGATVPVRPQPEPTPRRPEPWRQAFEERYGHLPVTDEEQAAWRDEHGWPPLVRQTPSGPVTVLAPRQLTAARLLLAGRSVGAVAAHLGVNRHTVSKWLKDEDFMREVRRMAMEMPLPAPSAGARIEPDQRALACQKVPGRATGGSALKPG